MKIKKDVYPQRNITNTYSVTAMVLKGFMDFSIMTLSFD